MNSHKFYLGYTCVCCKQNNDLENVSSIQYNQLFKQTLHERSLASLFQKHYRDELFNKHQIIYNCAVLAVQ